MYSQYMDANKLLELLENLKQKQGGTYGQMASKHIKGIEQLLVQANEFVKEFNWQVTQSESNFNARIDPDLKRVLEDYFKQ